MAAENMKVPQRTVYTIVLLVSVYIALQLIADVTAPKIVALGPITLPAGTFVFALTFTWRDMLHKRLGKEWARAAIIAAAVCNVLMVLYYAFAIELPPAGFWSGQDAFQATLGLVWRITAASIVAELVSELVDTEVYHVLAKRFTGVHQWVRVAGSNAVSLPIDSLVFVTLAFAGTMPLASMVDVIVGQVIFKALVTLVSLPGIYTIPEGKPLELRAADAEG
ncbi:MAG: queuosine precursor transporter [Anaerolineae bacterium]|nr:queuosine precursor transporter [Anaerolineae bacterium]